MCPRLVAFRLENRTRWPDWHNAPVPSFGPLDARVLIVGLGPGLRGANRTGRPFTGDFAGDLLYPTLLKFGFAQGAYSAPRDDGAWPGDALKLVDARITNAERCVPPQNKPLPVEIENCRRYLAAEISTMARLSVIVALGRVAHDAVLRALDLRPAKHGFSHGAWHDINRRFVLADSYHCSRYNTNTGTLTPEMFEAVFARARKSLPDSPAGA